MVRVSREDVLSVLEVVKYGLAKRELIAQSSKFVFQDGTVTAYNDEVHCVAPSPFGDEVSGAVFADKVLESLRDFKDDSFEVAVKNESVVFKGVRDRVRVRTDHEIILQMDQTAKVPEKWTHLPDYFLDALAMASKCVSRDESMPELTCVHVHPKWVEGCDNHQLVRYALKTGVKASVFVRGDGAQYAASLGMVEYADTESWLYFRNAKKVVYGCRKFVHEYHDFKPFLTIENASPLSLSRELVEPVKQAYRFSKEQVDHDFVNVELSRNRIRITGTGPTGDYTGEKRVRYDGPGVSFDVSPAVLTSLVENHQECEINADRLRVRGDRWRYTAVLAHVDRSRANGNDHHGGNNRGQEDE